MKKFVTDNIQIYNQDFINGVKALNDNSIDLVICDPPYGAASTNNWNYESSKKINGFGGKWSLNTEIWDQLKSDYNFSSTILWLQELQRVVSPSGSIWIHASYHNSGFVNVACQLLGLEIINEVIWYKRNAFPNLSKRRLTASHETIFWIHTGGPKNRRYLFNYDDVKDSEFEGDNIKKIGKQLRTVWDIPNNKRKIELEFGKHPTQKPLKVSERILTVAGKKGGKLLVPFLGSGTEILTGAEYGMECIGYEIDTNYFDLAEARIKNFLNERY